MYNIANTTLPGECYQGEVRLADTTDVGRVSQEGRVEVCVNNAWGTVCDRQFGAVDAAVFCDQVTGFQRIGELHVGRVSYLAHLYHYSSLEGATEFKFVPFYSF